MSLAFKIALLFFVCYLGLNLYIKSEVEVVLCIDQSNGDIKFIGYPPSALKYQERLSRYSNITSLEDIKISCNTHKMPRETYIELRKKSGN